MWDLDEQIRRVYENPYDRDDDGDLCLESYFIRSREEVIGNR